MAERAKRRHYRVAQKEVQKNQGTVIPKEMENQVLGMSIGFVVVTFILGVLLGKVSK